MCLRVEALQHVGQLHVVIVAVYLSGHMAMVIRNA